LLIAQHLDAGYDTVLAEGKSANPMVTRGTQRPRALIALHDCRVLSVISAIHLLSLSSQVSS